MEQPMTKDFRIIFMGTPEFAVASLKALIDSDFHVVAVVTSPDKPAGRGQKIKESEIKQFANKFDILVLQPEKLKSDEFIQQLKSLKADLQVVVAFRMLPEVIWSMPRLGTINLHASLLPQYRGAAPINHAIMNGDKKSGVTTFFIEKDIDTGKIIDSEEVEIKDSDNAGILHDKLMETGARLLVKTVKAIQCNNYTQIDQYSTLAFENPLRPAPKLFKDSCKIQWDQDIYKIYNFIRGLSPYPTAWTVLQHLENSENITIKIFETAIEIADHGFIPGSIISDVKSSLKVAVNGGFLQIKSIQAEGKRRLDIEEFLRGFKNILSYRFV
jgi:methionyl-tRNA formyltransferase